MSKKLSINDLIKKDGKTGDILYFVVLIVITHFIWKILINGNEHGHQISFAGKDVTGFFYQISLFTAKISWQSLHYIFRQNFSLNGVEIILNDHSSVSIIWACSAVKQIYMFICLILFYPKSSWKKKIIYTLCGCLVLELFNIIRIDAVAYGSSININYFNFLHKITQYGFYVVMFFLWILWTEKIIPEKPETEDTSSFNR
ncbi:MAG: exosortase/archaeosortase family protein [Candidatus Azobacteroides sp.]|nr:exosortase/archaeosortase family protein [Candidatus Azobacteroides sp.]